MWRFYQPIIMQQNWNKITEALRLGFVLYIYFNKLLSKNVMSVSSVLFHVLTFTKELTRSI